LRAIASRIFLILCLVVPAIVTFGCGSTSPAVSTITTPSASNVQPISVNVGPSSALGPGSNYVDGAFTSVTVCVPGSTTQCQTIDGILVDTGSSGLRILSSALSVALPQQTDSSNNAVAECAVFADGLTWGPVQTADVKIAGEQASSLPIQVIGSQSFSTVPLDCSSQGTPEDDLASLGANGLLGVGPSIQDCGTDCVTSGQLSQGVYFTCPSSGCTDTTEGLLQQVQNPVASFATDNNGVIVELPAVSGAEAGVNGSLIFGIGTQSNNGLGSATVFGTDAFGDFTTTFTGTQYPAFLDSGSNAIYFLDATTTGLPVCADLTFLYCPTTAQHFTVTNNGSNGASGSITFTVANADLITSDLNNAAINGLAGPNTGQFDFVLPFFFGRNVYTAIEGKTTPGGTGPYLAY
jgi:hypothetical protein